MGNFAIQKTQSGWSFSLLAANGQKIAVSEAYGSEAACRKGIESVRAQKDAPLEDLTEAEKSVPNPKFQLYRDKRGAYRFRLKARNGRIIAVSQGYRSKNACLEGIDSVRSQLASEELP